jgi:hypothetical protein
MQAAVSSTSNCTTFAQKNALAEAQASMRDFWKKMGLRISG